MPVISTITQPLPAAVEQLAGRAPLGSPLSAAEWMLVPAEIRLRAMFSSRVECERLLAEFHDRLNQRINLESSRLADGGEGVTMDRGRFVREMREYLDKTGYRPDPRHKGTLRDLTSQGRLGLIWQMNIDQAQGYAEWKNGNSRVALHTFPAMEFIRLAARREIRVWPEIWAAHGGKFYGQPGPAYPNAPGRMLALKTDPIWIAINRFGVPWKPFDWGSGMGTRAVGRREALALGVLQDDDAPQVPPEVPYNQHAQASLKGISPARRRAIEDAFAGDVEIEGDTIRMLPPDEPAAKPVMPPLAKELSAPMAKARRAVADMSDKQIAKAMQPIRETTAYRRIARAADAAGEPVTDSETVTRALIQFFAVSAGMDSLIRAARLEPGRDFLWGDMDFSGVFSYLSKLIGGGS